VGFYLGRTILGVTKWSPGEIPGASIDARPLMRDTKSTYDRKGRWYEQVEDR